MAIEQRRMTLDEFLALPARAEISHIGGTDSSGVIETLLALRLIRMPHASAAVVGRRFWRTTADFLRPLGLGSLANAEARGLCELRTTWCGR